MSGAWAARVALMCCSLRYARDMRAMILACAALAALGCKRPEAAKVAADAAASVEPSDAAPDVEAGFDAGNNYDRVLRLRTLADALAYARPFMQTDRSTTEAHSTTETLTLRFGSTRTEAGPTSTWRRTRQQADSLKKTRPTRSESACVPPFEST